MFTPQHISCMLNAFVGNLDHGQLASLTVITLKRSEANHGFLMMALCIIASTCKTHYFMMPVYIYIHLFKGQQFRRTHFLLLPVSIFFDNVIKKKYYMAQEPDKCIPCYFAKSTINNLSVCV